ncbi:esterase [Streptomyces rimosus subsp. pseudoverticillatus]|uniref:enterochelin esterase n=1 Tax=Streptomyces rimosus TaxID=1927 RepID=UPI0006B29367|nr:enterochelin esterase [Streptomyces rimosus]KOT78256.1 esterase [Streptomyces rimosus subsp. pseudoverticillatus]
MTRTNSSAPTALPATPPRTPRPHPAETAKSPRLIRLAAELAEAGSPRAHAAELARFWAETAATGTPLVEPLDGDPEHRAVTFLWRGDPATRQVLVLVNRLMDRTDLTTSLMRHLPGTDVWHLTYRLRTDHRGSYRIAPDTGGRPPGGLDRLAATGVRDPLNPHTIAPRWHGPPGSVFELPHAPARPWPDPPRPGMPRGTVRRHQVPSAALGGDREVWTYEPAAPRTGRADGHTLVLLDGDMWFGQLHLEDILDGLISDGTVPPLTVLAPHAVDNATRAREFGGRPAYVDFLAGELLPWAAGHLPVATDPARTVVAGQSLGGLTALYAGYAAPHRFGNVLAQSASLWWHPPGEQAGETAWITRRYAEGAPRALRLHLDVGLHEWGMLEQTRDLRHTLRAGGHTVTGADFNGGHDYACWTIALAQGLIALLGPEAPPSDPPSPVRPS